MRDKGDLIPPHGGYRKLRSFQSAQQVYDGTVIFCDRFVDKRSRTYDQMVQAARSGVQRFPSPGPSPRVGEGLVDKDNSMAEGSMASATSKKTELKLTNVARASLEELLLDFQDFLRQRGMCFWDKNSSEALAVRKKYRSDPSDVSDQSDPSDPYSIKTATAETAANTLICLINQASYLRGRQLEKLEQDFLSEGGFTERLYQKRQAARKNQNYDERARRPDKE